MLTTSPSPRLNPSPHSEPIDFFGTRSRYDLHRPNPPKVSSPIAKTYSTHVYPAQSRPIQCPQPQNKSTSVPACSNPTHIPQNRPNMVDAGTQYSPPSRYRSPVASIKTPSSHVAKLQLTDQSPNHLTETTSRTVNNIHKEHPTPTKRQHSNTETNREETESKQNESKAITTEESGPTKKIRSEMPSNVIMPLQYENCDTRELVVLISSMLLELIRYNDTIPLRDGHLTRFHSRAPPGISVIDYLQRLTTHATLSPPILLSMVYYIDRLCALYPAFTISSLTVHRFLITSATVASKGLSDSFWTNRTYAKVGGVSVRELALLELEFLVRVQWRIVPKPEVLVDYYRSLVERSPGYELEQSESMVLAEEEAESRR